ncbi:zinc finger homeobox protein 3-like [Sardina pilchardus]|uniref:zinc finger homeobox protein 3-like n=1 Tax=Sardina pilchardus TaxID=27697 RepID=UPI002E0FA6A7
MEFCDSTDHEGSQTQPPWRLPHPGLLLLPKDQTLSLGTLSPLIPSPLLHLQSPTAAAEKALRRRPTTGAEEEEEDEEEENGGGAEERRRDEGGVNGMDQGFAGQVGGDLGAGSDVGEEDCYDENEMVEEFEEDEEDEGDVEELAGEIVYRPDGSAFVVENLNQLSQREAEGDTPTPPPAPQPPLTISTCHIAASLAPWFHPPSQNQNQNPNQTQIQTPVQPGPTLHSFSVFHLHRQDDGQQPTSNGLPKDDFLTEAADVSGGRASGLPGRRPILMCFLCRLSFGCARSFSLHAAREHGVAPSDRERRLLALKNASAIIQPVAPGNRPLLSFLEPKIGNLDDDERDLAEAGGRGNGSSGGGSSSKGGLREEALANQSDISKSPLLATPAHTQTPTLDPSLSTPAGAAEGTSFTPSAAPPTSFNCLSRAQPVSPADDSGKTGSPASAPRDECANGESANATQPNDGSPDRATASSSSFSSSSTLG